MDISPYTNQPVENWKNITKNLIKDYPVSKNELLEIAILSWKKLWGTRIGGEININEVELPATIIGYFFQKLFAHELSLRYPCQWRGEQTKRDKDLVNIINPKYSTEMKVSGQLGYYLFGNRSYNQQSNSEKSDNKQKSGYYITLNFFGKTMTLLRLGWIDQSDWVPQGAQTGQAAILKPEVYEHKLVEINGNYRNESPIGLLKGIGKKAVEEFHHNGVFTFNDLKKYHGNSVKIQAIKKINDDFLNSFDS